MKITEQHIVLALGSVSAELEDLEDTLYQLAKHPKFNEEFAATLTRAVNQQGEFTQ